MEDVGAVDSMGEVTRRPGTAGLVGFSPSARPLGVVGAMLFNREPVAGALMQLFQRWRPVADQLLVELGALKVGGKGHGGVTDGLEFQRNGKKVQVQELNRDGTTRAVKSQIAVLV